MSIIINEDRLSNTIVQIFDFYYSNNQIISQFNYTKASILFVLSI